MTRHDQPTPSAWTLPEQDLLALLRGPMDDVCSPLFCPPTVVIAPLAAEEPDLTHIAVLGYN